MKTTVILLAVIGILIFSCHSKRNQFSSDGLSGAYAREYTFEVVHPETGAKVGMRAIRDTIFVRSLDEGYEVSNSKWKLNDYDNGGWTNMEHAEDRPMPAYHTTFSRDKELLHAEAMPDLFLDLGNGKLFKEEDRDQPYQKVK